MSCQLGPLMTDMAGSQRVWGSFVTLLSWKHFPNSISLLWIAAKKAAVWLKKSSHLHPWLCFWFLDAADHHRDEYHQPGKRQGSGRHLPDCSSHSREQQDGNRDLGMFTAGRDVSWSSVILHYYSMELDCIASLILTLPRSFCSSSSWWSTTSGSLDYPGLFIPAHLCWTWLWNGSACCKKGTQTPSKEL